MLQSSEVLNIHNLSCLQWDWQKRHHLKKHLCLDKCTHMIYVYAVDLIHIYIYKICTNATNLYIYTCIYTKLSFTHFSSQFGNTMSMKAWRKTDLSSVAFFFTLWIKAIAGQTIHLLWCRFFMWQCWPLSPHLACLELGNWVPTEQ